MKSSDAIIPFPIKKDAKAQLAQIGYNSQLITDSCKGKSGTVYDIVWTGFKPVPNSHSVCGQWIAWNKQLEKYAYSGVPGGLGWYQKGERFDLKPRDSQDDLLGTTNGKIKEAQALRSYEELIAFLRKEG